MAQHSSGSTGGFVTRLVPADAGTRLRACVVGGILLCFFLVVVGRLVQLQIVEHDRYKRLARRQQIIRRKLAGQRGGIMDSRGRLLATSVQRWSVFADPSEVRSPRATALVLARMLGVDRGRMERRLARGKYFAWVKRQVSDAEAARVRRLNIPGIHMRRESKRIYPQGGLASHVIGFTDIDGRGLAGAELELDALLAARAGYEAVGCDVRRQIIRATQEAAHQQPVHGCDVYLTIDSYLQSTVERELAGACERHRPEAASAVVLDPWTGDVLALANKPSFDPARRGQCPPDHRRNRAVTDVYEFGSVFKPFTVAGALDAAAVTPQTTFDCRQGLWRVGRRTLHDVHPYGELTVSDIVSRSSNIGAAQIAMALGREEFHRFLTRFQFDRPTGVLLPGEAGGIVRPLRAWNNYSVVSVAFGQEIAFTPLALARAVCAVANGGVLLRPRVVRKVVRSDTGDVVYASDRPRPLGRAMSARTAAQVLAMMRRVVEEGTGRRAQIQDYPVAGKTGTAQLLREDGRGYSRNRYLASFVGIAPADRPRIVVLVALKRPRRNGYYGGVVAAPVCREIMRRALKYLNVPPQPPVQMAEKRSG